VSSEVIAQRCFRLPDLQWFAEVSGDWNPIHVDPVAARRLLAGEVVVHGVFAVLWAMEAHLAGSGFCPARVNARFHSPILLEEPLILTRQSISEDEVRLAIVRGEQELTSILLSSGGRQNGGTPIDQTSPRDDAQCHDFAAMKRQAGELPVAAPLDKMQRAFSQATASMGALPVAAIAGLSRIVGMECPGLNSLFTSVDLALDPDLCEPLIKWQVTRHTIPQAPIRIAISGGGIDGRLEAFVRPTPVAQATIDVAATIVERGAFRQQQALIVGGSRGLGETTAKLIAAGGGQAIVTYKQGAADARRVADEITAWGGDCRTFDLDVECPETAITSLISAGTSPTHVYYFASPRIGRAKATAFDVALFESFSRIYVSAFSRLVLTLMKQLKRVTIFYPSTVFLDEMPREFAEYVAAKAAGEALCRHFERHNPALRVLIDRLPRLATDQTAGFVKHRMADPLPELLRVVKGMETLGKEQDERAD
jgi:hypothetical protein